MIDSEMFCAIVLPVYAIKLFRIEVTSKYEKLENLKNVQKWGVCKIICTL